MGPGSVRSYPRPLSLGNPNPDDLSSAILSRWFYQSRSPIRMTNLAGLSHFATDKSQCTLFFSTDAASGVDWKKGNMNIPASWLPCTVPLYCKWNRKHLIMMSGKRDLLATLRSKSIDIGSFHGRSRDDEFGSNNNLKSGGVSWIEMSQTTLKGLMQMPSQ